MGKKTLLPAGALALMILPALLALPPLARLRASLRLLASDLEFALSTGRRPGRR